MLESPNNLNILYVFLAKAIKQPRRCEVIYPYSPMNKDELELCVGETIEIMSEVQSQCGSLNMG